MGNPKENRRLQAVSGPRGLTLRFPADPASVRQALKTAMAAFGEMPVAAGLGDVVEIVLAEVLNNVVEHACAENGRGLVELEVVPEATALAFLVRDDGEPMPGGDAPEGRAHDLDAMADDLPEGGFGWFLIRELTQDLSYARTGTCNELRFRIALDAREPS